MTKESRTEIAIVACSLVAVAAASFLAGFLTGKKKKKKMVITEKGELQTVEID